MEFEISHAASAMATKLNYGLVWRAIADGSAPAEKMVSPSYWQFGILAGSEVGHDSINDLFEFEGQPVPAQRPDNAVIEAMARRQFEFLRQPLQIEIGEQHRDHLVHRGSLSRSG